MHDGDGDDDGDYDYDDDYTLWTVAEQKTERF
jgi:hypothetical protein